ncbi:NADH dehydrogenase [ubiquinone] 1 alpha subcomplex assembly factor 4 [Maylandia zebra]|uniref:NADH dehydrogenase [ubiquinone] 1 alpha subcomplex assembly factor 4 n=1 Tax=Maylandia zebra TaxID=106582 RepID=UPI00403D1B03
MGARVTRVFRNYNLENRVHRELSKDKPRAAPRHSVKLPPTASSPQEVDSLNQNNAPLLDHLRSVYVESRDPAPAAAEVSKDVTAGREQRRLLKFSVPASPLGLVELTDVPIGKLTIAEALKAVGSHQHQPQMWSPEKIAQEYSLDLKETKALLDFFVPFKVEIIPPKTKKTKQIKAS